MTTTAEIEAEIATKIRADASILPKLREKAEEVADFWRRIAPVSTAPAHTIGEGKLNYPGEYRADVQVDKAWHYAPNGMPAMTVRDRNPLAHLIEYGSVDPRPQGGHIAEHAVRARVEAHFARED